MLSFHTPHKQILTLDITVNKPVKSFIINKYNEWFFKKVSQQHEKGIQSVDVKVSLGLIELKVMHAKWIMELYNHLYNQNEIILNRFKAAGITETVESANTVLERIEFMNYKMYFQRHTYKDVLTNPRFI